ncbi:MAG TPA: extracellular solute-binding protein [Stellaceae bacterium]|jgi:iron(III) transport system substrate-binding protein|nr:extracellular solute-binding protein [Stellaceae bacterium]
MTRKHGLLRWFGAALIASLAFAIEPSPVAAQDWKAEFQKIVDAAGQEGTLIFYSQPNKAAQDFILGEFPKAYPKIKVSLSAMPGAEFIARIKTERGAGKYLWDVALAGPPVGYVLAHADILDPVMPEFVDPEIKNPELWGGWHNAFTDVGGKYEFAIANFIAGPWYNALKIPPEKVDQLGLKLMLDPSVKGKIAWHDPAVQGAGQPYTLLLRAKLGDEGLKQIITEQQPQFYKDQFQVVEAMARGTAWIGIGPPVRALMAPYMQAGVKTDIRNFGPTPDLALQEIGGSGLFVFKERPHPNAARVFINWLLSKDVQYGLAKATEQASRRLDVPLTTAPDETPVKGATYLQPQREDATEALQSALALAAEDRKLVK